MIKFILVLSLINLLHQSLLASAEKIDHMNGVNVKSFKEEEGRVYVGTIKRILTYDINMVLKSITNFSEKCNNKFKSKRKYTPTDSHCKYHNENLIETFFVRDIKNKNISKNIIDSYLLGRHIFNRGTFGYYELITIREGLNRKKQKTITVSSTMLNDNEVKKFTSPKFSRETAFDKTDWRFKLTQVSENETHVAYKYTSQTKHWILNKEVSVPQVFLSMSKSISDLLSSVEKESLLQKQAAQTKK
jgi:hypothetical protein